MKIAIPLLLVSYPAVSTIVNFFGVEKEIRWQHMYIDSCNTYNLSWHQEEYREQRKKELNEEIMNRETYISELKTWKNQWLWDRLWSEYPRNKYSEF